MTITPSLFDAEIVRDLDVGGIPVTVRLLVEPVEGERVRVVRYERRRGAAERFDRMKGEEGRLRPWETLQTGRAFADVFPAGGRPVEAPARRRRRR